jgi:Flp pilus assembly protein TadG
MVELSLISPILILCLAGAMDLGRFVYTVTALTGAANAGVQYGVQSTAKSTDYTGMHNAAIAAAPTTLGASAMAVIFDNSLASLNDLPPHPYAGSAGAHVPF